MNRRELRQQTLSAIEFLNADRTLSGASKESSITLLRRLAHQSESALTRCQIAEIKAADVRQKYAGKHASRTNRTKLSEAWVVDNMEMVCSGPTADPWMAWLWQANRGSVDGLAVFRANHG